MGLNGRVTYFISYLTVWDVEPLVTPQTLWLESTMSTCCALCMFIAQVTCAVCCSLHWHEAPCLGIAQDFGLCRSHQAGVITV